MISYEKAIDITKQFANDVKDLLKDNQYLKESLKRLFKF